MSELKYSKNDFVVYGTNGICKIEDIQKMTFPMETAEHTYYVLKPISAKASTLFVPSHKEELVSKMRYVLKREEIDEILNGTRGKDIDWIEDKNGRANLFRQLIRDGKPEELLILIRCIYKRKTALAEKSKKLTSTDEGVLSSAEKLVREEFAYTLGITEDEVTEYIRAKLGETK